MALIIINDVKKKSQDISNIVEGNITVKSQTLPNTEISICKDLYESYYSSYIDWVRILKLSPGCRLQTLSE